jgi:glucosamine--fructose-6-phosphate aminotransferase (isomerizing)
MCGIVGYVGDRNATPILMDGLRRLEYRGYDSAGVAVLAGGGAVEVRKREGKLARLDELLAADTDPLAGSLGLGHTRWATHGPPTTSNAHPHHDEARRIVVVHNGIIENYAALRAALIARGHTFSSETDSEVIAHLIEERYDGTDAGALPDAVRQVLAELEGAYAVAVVAAGAPDTLVAARQFSPLVVGLGEGESFLASDIGALLAQTRRVVPLEDGEMAVLGRGGMRLTDRAGNAVLREPIEVTWDAAAAEKAGYAHFVRKEIDEQPRALADTLRGRLAGGRVTLPELDGLDLGGIRRVTVVACGSSFYAGLVAKAWIERWARLPVEVAVASELRYGDPVLDPETLVVLVTQSGETADTLAAMHRALAAGAPTLAITNSVGSSVTRGAAATLYLQVGPEIGVVATKTFTGQLALLALLAMDLGLRRGTLDAAEAAGLARDLAALPALMTRALAGEAEVARAARALADRRSMFFIGRGFGYPIALEGALKLKEISYLHAEGYAAGELKHGPIAMLDASFPVFAIATASPTYDKVISNIEEVRARGAAVVAVATEGDARIADLAEAVLHVPAVRDELSPFVTVIPTQLFAYHAAVALGRDVDQPRNLAKSVTVE